MTELDSYEVEALEIDRRKRIRNRILAVIGLYFLLRIFRNENSLFYLGGGSELSSSVADVLIGLCFYLIHQA